jgi:hypothetical protein
MTKITFKNKNTKKLVTILPAIALGMLMATILVNNANLMKVDATSNPISTLRPVPPLSFSTTVNGHEKAEVVATVNQGQTVQLDLLATPLISGMSGDVEVYSSLPECGTVNVQIGCTPHGITVSLPSNVRVSSATHLPLTISVSKDMPPGTYWFSIATTPVKDPSKNLPESSGYIEAFAIRIA